MNTEIVSARIGLHICKRTRAQICLNLIKHTYEKLIYQPSENPQLTLHQVSGSFFLNDQLRSSMSSDYLRFLFCSLIFIESPTYNRTLFDILHSFGIRCDRRISIVIWLPEGKRL